MLISAVVPCRNEERVIGRCLESLSGVADEVIVVHDGPCADRTLEIARELGAEVHERPHTGVPEGHTVWAYERARGEWLLNLDADEFLSEGARAGLRALAGRDDVNGWALLWRMWDGTRYITERGPYKLVLMRRSATRFLGVPHGFEEVEGRVERTPLHLEHRPGYDNFALRTMWVKWRSWARRLARAYLQPWSAIPKFRYDGVDDWPLRRRVVNAVSPVAFLPLGIVQVLLALRAGRAHYAPRENLRFALYEGIYTAMVHAYVARFRYLGDPAPGPESVPYAAHGG